MLLLWIIFVIYVSHFVAQSVTCLTADMCLTADPGVASSIQAWSNTFAEIDHEITQRPFSSLPLIQEGLFSVTSENMCTKNWLTV